MRERQDVILGGGLAGLTAAYTLQRAGETHWQLYERADRLGGLATTVAVDGYLFDHGPHILFTIDKEIEALMRDLLGENFHAQERQAFIYHHAHGGLYTRFPFQAHLHGLPAAIVSARLLSSLVFGTSPGDPAVFVGVPIALLVTVVFAGFVPARRAMRVDPLVALRYE